MSTMTPDDRVRQQIAREVAPDVVLAIYRVMKGNKHARFEQISNIALAVLATEVNDLLSTPELHRRINLVNLLTGCGHALAESEQRDVERQARADRRRAADLTAIKAIVPGMCCLCASAIGDRPGGTLQVTEALNADVHEDCAQKHPSIEIVSSFSFRLKGGE